MSNRLKINMGNNLPEESPNPSELNAILPNSKEVLLYEGNDLVETSTTNPLYKEGEMPDGYEHINGNVLAVIKLPVHNYEDPKITEKYASEAILAVVDYGEDFREKLYFDNVPGLGSPMSRFMVRGMNYVPEDHLMPTASIGNEGLELGTDPENPKNRDLGLTQFHRLVPFDTNETEGQRSMLSRSHVSIELAEDGGSIRIIDHSTNHTEVIVADMAEGGAGENSVVEATTSRLKGSLISGGGERDEGGRIWPGEDRRRIKSWRVDGDHETRATGLEADIDATKADIDTLKKEFSDEEAQTLWEYVSNSMNKTEAQKEGDDQGSMLFGQLAGRAYSRLSDRAIEVAPKYRKLMERLEELNKIRATRA